MSEASSAHTPETNLMGIVRAFVLAHKDGPGLLDAVDNDGNRYTSQFLANTIAEAEAVLATAKRDV